MGIIGANDSLQSLYPLRTTLQQNVNQQCDISKSGEDGIGFNPSPRCEDAREDLSNLNQMINSLTPSEEQ